MYRHQPCRWVFALVLSAVTIAAPAQPGGAALPAPRAPISLAQAPLDVSAFAASWVQSGEPAAIEKVVQNLGPFQPSAARPTYQLGRGKTLWLHLRVQRTADGASEWVLQVPMPVLDSVTAYQRNAAGQWKAQTAGDTVDMALWPEPGRYPFFRLMLAPGETRDVFLKVRHSTVLSLPVRLVPVARHDLRTQTEYMGLGIVFGAILLLIGLCAVRGWALRDGGYAWYTLYAIVSLLAVAAYTGVAAQLLWTGAQRWIDASPGVLALLAACLALLIVRGLSGVVTRQRWLARLIFGVVLLGPLLAVVYLFLERPTGVAVLGVYLMTVAALSITAATLAWVRGDEVGVWVMAGALPLALAVMLVLAAAFGIIAASWVTEYALVSGIALALPMLYGALHNRSRERRGAEFRQMASSSQDALTGLLTARVFQARVEQAVARFHKHGEGAAVMLIEMANHGRIKDGLGSAVAEECLLRAVVQLRHLVRDVDTTGRVGEARFGLILEGVDSRAVVSDRATRMIAAGLRSTESPNGPEVTLQFQIAAVLLTEHVREAPALIFALGDQLASMSSNTRRPIRFLDSGEAQPSNPDAVTAPMGLSPPAA
jgi:two-component system, sensor histidine kinase LadS